MARGAVRALRIAIGPDAVPLDKPIRQRRARILNNQELHRTVLRAILPLPQPLVAGRDAMKYCALATMGFALAFGFPTASSFFVGMVAFSTVAPPAGNSGAEKPDERFGEMARITAGSVFRPATTKPGAPRSPSTRSRYSPADSSNFDVRPPDGRAPANMPIVLESRHAR
jgi:hypothetical protein